MSAIRQLPQAISYCLMKPCYPLTYRKLQNFQTTVLDGKNWENAETVQLEDLRKTLRNCTVIGHTRLAGINFRDWRSTVSHSVTKIAPKSPVLCVNKSPVLDLFSTMICGGAKAIRCSANCKPSLSKIPPHSTTHKAGSQRTLTYQ